MRVLFFGAGPLGSFYAHLLHASGGNITVLARGERYAWLKKNGLVLLNEITGEAATTHVNLVDELRPQDEYDLVIVLVRKNRLPAVFETLAASPGLKNILFMGNNALGFGEYLKALPAAKVFFGFPGAGGGIRNQVVHYADREKPRGPRRAVTIGEADGLTRERTLAARSLFEHAGVPVELSPDIDGWLKYHVALVSPLVGALYKHNCDNYLLAKDREMLRLLIKAAKEGGRVLRALGFSKRQPFQYNLFYWLPEVMSMMAVKGLLESKFAEVAFAMHAQSARDEMREIAREFHELTERTSISTPSIEALGKFIN